MTIDKTFLRRSGNPDVYSVKEDDVQLIQAIEKAKHTIKYFKESLESPKENQTCFSIKTKLTDGNHVEHIWLDAAEISDKIVYGIVNNVPANLKNIELGKRIGVSEDEITDWLIIENNRLIGGYTIRAIRDKMSRAHRELFESTINFKIDHGVDYFEANNLTPEGIILCVENAYDEKDIDKLFSHIDFISNAKVLMSTMKGWEHLVTETTVVEQMAETLQLSLQAGLLRKGWPTFSHLQRAFIKKEFLPDNIILVTEVMFYNGQQTYTNKLYVKKQDDGTYKFAGDAK